MDSDRASEPSLPTRLSRNPSFRWYWSALAVSGTGSAVSVVVLPIVAAASLGASPTQMALLGAMGMLPGLLLQVPAAMWADSIQARLGIMVATQALQGVLVAIIPVLWWLDALTFMHLVTIVALKALLGVFLAATSSPLIVEVVPPDQLVAASGRLNGTRSATDIVGQAAGGGLLALVAAPVLLLADAVSFLLAAVLTRRIHVSAAPSTDSGPRPKGRFSVRDVAAIGKRLVTRIDVWCVVAIALVNGISEAVFILFCLHSLNITASAIGLLLAAGAFGGVFGGFLVGRMLERFGRWTVGIGLLTTVWSITPLPFVGPGLLGGVAVVNFELAGAFGGTVIMAAVFGTLQAEAAADGTVARTMALASNTLQIAALVGLAIGAAIGGAATPRAALAVSAVLLAAVSLPLLWRLRNHARSDHPDDLAGASAHDIESVEANLAPASSATASGG